MAWDYDAETGLPIYSGQETDSTPVPDVALNPPVEQQSINVDDLMSEAVGDIVMPPEEAGLTPQGNPVSQSKSFGQSVSGTSEDKFNRFEKQGEKYKQPSTVKGGLNQLEKDYTSSAEDQKAAVANLGALEAAKQAEEAKLTGELAAKQNQFVMESQAEYQAAQQKTLKYAGEYETQLKQLSMMSVNPGRLYSNMTKPERAGMLVAAFATDFLGAKGIKTSAMDTFNRAIDRDIEAQIHAIQNKGKVAEGFRSLWEMQRAQSSSDYEASLRMKGMALEAFKTEVAGKLGQFDSDIARAKIPLAMAEIDDRLNAHKMDIYKFRNDIHQQEANRAVSIRGQNIQAAQMEIAKRASEAKAKLEADEAARKAMDEKAKKAIRVAEPEMQEIAPGVKIPTGKKIGRVLGFYDAGDASQVEKFQDRISGTKSSLDMIERLRGLEIQEGGVYNWYGKRITKNEAEAELTSIYNDLISNITKARSGLTVTDAEKEFLKDIIPFPGKSLGALSSDGAGEIAAKIASKFALRQIEADNDAAVAKLSPPTEEEMKYFQGGTSGSFFDGHATSNKTFDKKAEPTPVEESIAKADGVNKDTNTLIREKDGGTVWDTATEFYTSEGFDGIPGTQKAGKAGRTARVDEWFVAMDELKNAALSPNTTPEERNKIIDYFSNFSQRNTSSFTKLGISYKGDDKDKIKVDAAEYFLQEILR